VDVAGIGIQNTFELDRVAQTVGQVPQFDYSLGDPDG